MRQILKVASSAWIGISLLILLTVACIHGSFVASDSTRGVVYARLHVFNTWWFVTLMLLLAMNLVLCSWRKSIMALRLFSTPAFIVGADAFKKAKHRAVLPWTSSLESVHKLLRERYTVVFEARATCLHARKGIVSRLGATVVHLGLLWALSAGMLRIYDARHGKALSDATIVVPEGQSTDSCYIDRDGTGRNLEEYRLPFRITELDFRAEYHPHSGVARHYSSLVELQDGEDALIREINMARPLRYKGYKITQNSFAENPEITRGTYEVKDEKAARTVEIDASPGLPVAIPEDGSSPKLFLVASLGAGQHYSIMDARTRKEIASGITASDTGKAGDAVPSSKDRTVAPGKLSIVLDDLYPNFRMDSNNRPGSIDDRFLNPAARLSVYRDDAPDGYFWLFLDPDLQKMMQQSHPLLSFTFDSHRSPNGDSSTTGMLHEAHITVTSRSSGREIGNFWLSAGRKQVLPSFTDREELAGADTDAGISGTSNPPGFTVRFLGATTGNTTYLGVMYDPGVNWVYIGVLVMIVGALMAYLLLYREVWVWLDTEQNQLHLATGTRATSRRVHREFRELVMLLETQARNKPSSEPSREETQ